jgi:hypothetical protein
MRKYYITVFISFYIGLKELVDFSRQQMNNKKTKVNRELQQQSLQ